MAVTHSISNAGIFVLIEVDNFVNPPSTSSITTITLNRSNLETGIGSLDDVQPDSMQSASVAPFDASNNIVGQTGARIKFTFTTKNTLPAGGRVRVVFPIWNPDDNVNS